MSQITKTAIVTICGRPNVGKSSLTNALVATVMDLRLKSALHAIFGGVLMAAVIVSLVTMGVVLL